jgi:hypothetical protein
MILTQYVWQWMRVTAELLLAPIEQDPTVAARHRPRPRPLGGGGGAAHEAAASQTYTWRRQRRVSDFMQQSSEREMTCEYRTIY